MTGKSKIISFLILLFLAVSANAQIEYRSEEELIEHADELFEDEQYEKAYPLYSQLLSLHRKNPEYNYKFGACLLFSDKRDKTRPIQYLEYANEQLEKDAFPKLHYFMGVAYHQNYRFKNAISAYKIYKLLGNKKEVERLHVDRQIQMCFNGIELLSQFRDLYVLNKIEVQRSNFYLSYKNEELPGDLIKKPSLFYSKADNKQDVRDVIFFSKDFDFVLYASLGKRAKTGKDIYIARKTEEGGWTEPQLLSPIINTPYNEDYPYLMPDGKTLYFSSDGHKTIGGYDIFKSEFDSLTNTWSEPENINFPFNTPYDDIMFVADTSNSAAYFSSTRSSVNDLIYVYKVGLERQDSVQNLARAFSRDSLNKDEIIAYIRNRAELNVNADRQTFDEVVKKKREEKKRKAREQALALQRAQEEALSHKQKGITPQSVDSLFDAKNRMDRNIREMKSRRLNVVKIRDIKQTQLNELAKAGEDKKLSESALEHKKHLEKKIKAEKAIAEEIIQDYEEKIVALQDIHKELSEKSGKLQEEITTRQVDRHDSDYVAARKLISRADSLPAAANAQISRLDQAEQQMRLKASKSHENFKEVRDQVAEASKELQDLEMKRDNAANSSERDEYQKEVIQKQEELAALQEEARQKQLAWIEDRAKADSILEKQNTYNQIIALADKDENAIKNSLQNEFEQNTTVALEESKQQEAGIEQAVKTDIDSLALEQDARQKVAETRQYLNSLQEETEELYEEKERLKSASEQWAISARENIRKSDSLIAVSEARNSNKPKDAAQKHRNKAIKDYRNSVVAEQSVEWIDTLIDRKEQTTEVFSQKLNQIEDAVQNNQLEDSEKLFSEIEQEISQQQSAEQYIEEKREELVTHKQKQSTMLANEAVDSPNAERLRDSSATIRKEAEGIWQTVNIKEMLAQAAETAQSGNGDKPDNNKQQAKEWLDNNKEEILAAATGEKQSNETFDRDYAEQVAANERQQLAMQAIGNNENQNQDIAEGTQQQQDIDTTAQQAITFNETQENQQSQTQDEQQSDVQQTTDEQNSQQQNIAEQNQQQQDIDTTAQQAIAFNETQENQQSQTQDEQQSDVQQTADEQNSQQQNIAEQNQQQQDIDTTAQQAIAFNESQENQQSQTQEEQQSDEQQAVDESETNPCQTEVIAKVSDKDSSLQNKLQELQQEQNRISGIIASNREQMNQIESSGTNLSSTSSAELQKQKKEYTDKSIENYILLSVYEAITERIRRTQEQKDQTEELLNLAERSNNTNEVLDSIDQETERIIISSEPTNQIVEEAIAETLEKQEDVITEMETRQSALQDETENLMALAEDQEQKAERKWFRSSREKWLEKAEETKEKADSINKEIQKLNKTIELAESQIEQTENINNEQISQQISSSSTTDISTIDGQTSLSKEEMENEMRDYARQMNRLDSIQQQTEQLASEQTQDAQEEPLSNVDMVYLQGRQAENSSIKAMKRAQELEEIATRTTSEPERQNLLVLAEQQRQQADSLKDYSRELFAEVNVRRVGAQEELNLDDTITRLPNMEERMQASINEMNRQISELKQDSAETDNSFERESIASQIKQTEEKRDDARIQLMRTQAMTALDEFEQKKLQLQMRTDSIEVQSFERNLAIREQEDAINSMKQAQANVLQARRSDEQEEKLEYLEEAAKHARIAMRLQQESDERLDDIQEDLIAQNQQEQSGQDQQLAMNQTGNQQEQADTQEQNDEEQDIAEETTENINSPQTEASAQQQTETTETIAEQQSEAQQAGEEQTSTTTAETTERQQQAPESGERTATEPDSQQQEIAGREEIQPMESIGITLDEAANADIYYSADSPIPAASEDARPGLIYKVQIAAFRNRVDDDVFRGIYPLSTERSPGGQWLRYMAGLFTRYAEALDSRNILRGMGYPDAFVVAYLNGQRISIAEARDLEARAAEAIVAVSVQPQQNTSLQQQTTQTTTTNTPEAIAERPAAVVQPESNVDGSVYFTVQVGVFGSPRTADQLYNVKDLFNDRMANGYYRYYSGRYNSRARALQARDAIRAEGISDAFVVSLQNMQRIPTAQATNLLGPQPEEAAEQVQQTPDQTQEAETTEVRFSVQIGAYRNPLNRSITAMYERRSGQTINHIQLANGIHIYSLGSFRQFAQAQALRQELLQAGFDDAFIIASRGISRISLDEARQILGL